MPDDVARVVMRSLSKDPDARQQTLAEFLDSLAEAASNAGLLNDARALLFGTVWGDDLAAPGSYLGELLGSSAPPSSPSPLADTQPIAVERDPDDERLLSSAPKPFGTTSHNLAAAPRRKQRSHKWLWVSLGFLTLVLVGVVAGTLWLQRAPRAVAEEPQTEPVEAPPAVVEEDARVADVGTDAPLVEPVVMEEAVEEEAVEEEQVVEEQVVEEEVAEEPPPVKPKAKPKKKKRKKEAVAAPVPVPVPATEPAPAGEPAGGGESETPSDTDDGIDWTVPDFPDDDSPPTGTPDAQPRNPVVIDEPPS